MKARITGCALLTFLLPLAASAATAAGAGCAEAARMQASVKAESRAEGRTDPGHAAETHLSQQYALHRASLYLYNPAGALQIADVPGLVVGKEH